ncbi:MAG: hypothetical protein K2X87_03515 [Gemmataceae bacterium]|nr:hypothetical protein [Gemmataceae bacterium]
MDEYLSMTLLSRPGEGEGAFKARLSGLWTAMFREKPAEFEKVYAEQVAFDRVGDRLGRKYLIEAAAVPAVEAAATAAGLEYQPVDRDDVYSKYEAAPPDWFWIEH